MTLEQLAEIMKNSLDQYRCGYFGIDDIPEEFEVEVVEDGGWAQDYKYQSCQDVLHFKDSDTYFVITNTRSGSPFTDWEYGEPYVQQVKKVIKIITVEDWEGV